MFRPDPNGYSIDEVVAKLADALKEVPADSSRAQRLADMIERLERLRESPESPVPGPRVRER